MECYPEQIVLENGFSRAIDLVPGLVWTALPDGPVDCCNRCWLEYTGLSAEEVAGEGWQAAIHSDDLSALCEAWRSTTLSGKAGEAEARLRRFDGVYRWFLFRANPVANASGTVVKWVGLNTDIDECKQVESALRSRGRDVLVRDPAATTPDGGRRRPEDGLDRLRAELALATQGSSLGALAAWIAHEINQPLAGMMTNASTGLRMLSAEPPNVEGALETMRRAIRDGRRASEVMTRLRALFRRRAVTTDKVDLNEVAGEVVELLRGEIRRNRIMLRVEGANDLPPVTGDRVQLQQVMLNLLLSAMEAMNHNGDRPRQILIRIRRCGEKDGAGKERERVRLDVIDSGEGFDPQEAGKLFGTFYTTKRGGMGIGLSASRFIIEGHGGRFWATSNGGVGATFSFSIPCRPGVSPASDRRLDPSGEASAEHAPGGPQWPSSR